MRTPDMGLARVREARTSISAEFGNDPAKLIAHYLEFQKQFEDRLCPGPTGEDPDRELDATEREHAADVPAP
jgi:hypothetical protein